MTLLPGADKKCLLFSLSWWMPSLPVPECPLAAENNLNLHNQLGKKAPLNGISEVTDVGHRFSMISVR